MELLILSLIFSVMVSNTIAIPSHSKNHRERDEVDSDGAESYIQTLATLPLENNVPEELLDAASLPHEALHQFSSYVPPPTGYGPPAVPVPTYGVPEPTYGVPAPTYGLPVPVPHPVGVTINKNVVLSPQVEIFRFIEAFLHFKTEIIARLQL
ncbi:hypothetical protein RN001_000256 [Aquatica leii]|uniref:Uncharacterized protein n=1 Tax=Aquatica leii TaxID=1421715 RepID=A0AAN7Q9I0_9COLE|nr:hypothetical protein RN001_000256 [Aquatica leii]